MLLVYSLIEGHPAEQACENLLRASPGWISSVLVQLEVRSVLAKVYKSPVDLVDQQLALLASGPVAFQPVDYRDVFTAFERSREESVDLTDAALLTLCNRSSISQLATDDRKLSNAARKAGLPVRNPIDSTLRNEIALWEAQQLPLAGLPRVLRRTHDWLAGLNEDTSAEFWNATGGCIHLP